MSAQIMYRIIVRGGMMTVLLFSISVSAMTIKPLTMPGSMSIVAHVLAHPPVTGDCAGCHPDVKTMPRII